MNKLLSIFALVIALLICLASGIHAQQRIAVSYPGIAGYNIPFWVAMDAGEFKKAGLEVDSVLISGGSKSMQALVSGGLDFAHTSGGVSVQAALSGADVTIIGTGSNSMSAGVIAAKEIKSYQDLRGKRIGIASFGGNNDIGLRYAFKKNGINPDKDVTFLQLGGERNRLTALERGGISATIISPPGLFVAEAQGYSRLGDLNAMGMRYPELSIVARKRDMKERRDLVRRYLRVYVESVRLMKSNRDMTIRLIEKYIHVGSKAEAVKTYDYFVRSISDTLRTEREGISEFLATLEPKAAGAAKRNPNVFIDESVLEEVLKGR
ncbi:MAG TPA: ABC transporter substrate-binding protein [Candidatus Acidoferrales bacterium]|nr:ABC transporter substrate-binding protein [Candidatus Acidoferrales bacterium]